MRVLLCLLSDQHVPNLLSVHHYKPDQLVLVESSAMKQKNVSTHFLDALRLGNLDYAGRCHIAPLGAEDNLAAVRQVLQLAYGKFPSDRWIANLTGGTKPMSIATHEFFKALGGELIYTNVAYPARLIDLENGHPEDCNYRLGIKEFLAGYGFAQKNTDKVVADAEARASIWTVEAGMLARQAPDRPILKLDEHERARARERGMELRASQSDFPCSEIRKRWLSDGTSAKLTKYEARFLTGGWLEVFFWNLLTRHSEKLGIWDVHVGLEVGRCGDQSGNELDVAFMHNSGLSMIECKSGSQEHDRGGDALYKVEAVKQQFGAIRVGAYLATTAGNILDHGGEIKKSIQARASIYRCHILAQGQIGELGRKSEDSEAVRALLFPERHFP